MSLLLTVLALVWLVATEDATSKDHLTNQALHKLLELQRTLQTQQQTCLQTFELIMHF